MINDTQRNKLFCYDFGANKHLRKVLLDEEIVNMTIIEDRFPLTKLPVCGHCESLGYWHKDPLIGKPVGICKKCGTITKHPVTYSTYLARGYDIDRVGDSFRRMAEVDKKCDAYKRAVYLPDFNRLDGGA
jgi:hypothetical protein